MEAEMSKQVVGVSEGLPEGWQEVELGEISTCYSGGTPFKRQFPKYMEWKYISMGLT